MAQFYLHWERLCLSLGRGESLAVTEPYQSPGVKQFILYFHYVCLFLYYCVCSGGLRRPVGNAPLKKDCGVTWFPLFREFVEYRRNSIKAVPDRGSQGISSFYMETSENQGLVTAAPNQ